MRKDAAALREEWGLKHPAVRPAQSTHSSTAVRYVWGAVAGVLPPCTPPPCCKPVAEYPEHRAEAPSTQG